MRLGISMIGVLAAAFACLIVAGGLTGPSGAGAPADYDNDGVYDIDDNCMQVYQTSAQRCDTNSDGYGNMCDPDLNDNGENLDVAPFLAALGFSSGQPSFNPDADLDCNGTVLDVASFLGQLGFSPGPSGLSCAGTIPCP